MPPFPFQRGDACVRVEVGEVASGTRYRMFGPSLYCLDAHDSFPADVRVAAVASVPLAEVAAKGAVRGTWRLREPAAGGGGSGAAGGDRADAGRAALQMAWFSLQS